ncbi:MAG TPA: phage holin family protein [Casimicrobiaceae bacterium]|nr:phage holin family protein [Casimicrobiaceae bacterium]
MSAALGDLLGSGRALVADAADLVAAEAHVALQMLTGMVISAVCAAVLGVLAVVALLAAIAAGLIERGVPAGAASVAVAIVCALLAAGFGLRLRALAKRALFSRSREQLRGAR